MADIRSIKTKENFKRAIEELLIVYKCEELTVDMICKEARSSRSTFYQYYENKEAIFIDLIDNIVRDMKKYSEEKLDGTRSFSMVMPEIKAYILNKKVLIKSFLEFNLGEAGLEDRFDRLYKEIFLQYNKNIDGVNIISEYFASITSTTIRLILSENMTEADIKVLDKLEKKFFDIL